MEMSSVTAHTNPMEISSVTAQARWNFPASLPQAPAKGILRHHILQMNRKAKIILGFIFAMWASGNLVLETTGSWISCMIGQLGSFGFGVRSPTLDAQDHIGYNNRNIKIAYTGATVGSGN